jgi:hypothetical protein
MRYFTSNFGTIRLGRKPLTPRISMKTHFADYAPCTQVHGLSYKFSTKTLLIGLLLLFAIHLMAN